MYFQYFVDKCLHPYYGGCSKTRLCTSTENGTICGSCLFGYEEDPEDPSGDCIRKEILCNVIYYILQSTLCKCTYLP